MSPFINFNNNNPFFPPSGNTGPRPSGINPFINKTINPFISPLAKPDGEPDHGDGGNRGIGPGRYEWGLWSVRRADLQKVYCAGFDYIRVPYAGIGNLDYSGTFRNPNYDPNNPLSGPEYYFYDELDCNPIDGSLFNYAFYAEEIGFKGLVYPLPIKDWYKGYKFRFYPQNQFKPRPGDPTSLYDIKKKIDELIETMNGDLDFNDIESGKPNRLKKAMKCQPYLDEYDTFGQVADEIIGHF